MRGRLGGNETVSTLAAVLARAVHTFDLPRRRAAVALMTLALAAGVTGCGSDESDDVTIPQDNAQAMLQALDDVETACGNSDSRGAQDAAAEFIDLVNQLPQSVGIKAKEALRDAGMNLKTLSSTSADCTGGETTTTPTTTSSSSTTPTSTSTSTTDSTSTSTETSTSTSTDTQTDTTDTGTTTTGQGGNGQGGGGGSGGIGGGG
jgi:hypothetical protein